MPIHPPGKRDRHNRRARSGRRKIVATLTLTAMVDMFTVLTVFLLQNYNATGQVIHIPKEVILPKASEVKELTPAHVVTISSKELLIDETMVTDFQTVKDTNGWIIPILRDKLTRILKEEEQKNKSSLKENLKRAVRGQSKDKEEKVDKPWTRVTVQADKDIEMSILKKVMATVTEAGIDPKTGIEINFAVAKKPDEEVPK
jgi:biopolymer transport protein ExbD